MKNLRCIILIITTMITASNTFSQQATERLITTEGKSSVKLAPEEIWVTVNLTAKDSNYTRCADMAIEKINGIKKLFIRNGIDENLIKTNSYSIREVKKYDRQARESVFNGYEATIPITIKTKRNYDKIFELIKSNLESNFNLNFSLSDEQIKLVKEKLISLAVEDAKQKSDIIAQSAGVKLGEIKSIQYGEPNLVRGNPQPDLRRNLKMAADYGGGASITETLAPKEIEMRTNIIISWEIAE